MAKSSALRAIKSNSLSGNLKVLPIRGCIRNSGSTSRWKSDSVKKVFASTHSACPTQGRLIDFSMSKTALIYQAAEHQSTTRHETVLQSIQTYRDLSESLQSLFKISEDETSILAIVTESTIFHPQGGGQPSDVGKMMIKSWSSYEFTVLMARMLDGVVVHFGKLAGQDSISLSQLPGAQVEQLVDPERRFLFSRLHTAGHVLGTATRALLESKIDNFDELKASHFPDSAACEFQGLIDGKYKSEVQQAVDELVAEDREVRIEWWTKGDFEANKLSRLLPDDETWAEIATIVDENGKDIELSPVDHSKTRIRVVNIVGAEIYPCGGTHCKSTKPCGPVKVKKISRAKGNSRISYQVE